MKTRFNDVNCNWKRVKNHCRTTDNKDFTEHEPSMEWKKKLLISEHSPIRLIEVDWSWEDIKSWVATHWSRHKWECFISTQRDDRKKHTISRDDMPQATLVKFDGFANIQNLIDTFRKRLCPGCVSPETYALAVDFKIALHKDYPELADVLVPNCIYRASCPEFKPCYHYVQVFWDDFSENPKIGWLNYVDIQKRYDAYNEWFYENMKEA